MKKIEELLKKQSELEVEKYQIDKSIYDILLAYHNKLINCNFYQEFKINGTALEHIFLIQSYDFPYSDHGEGDCIKIDFEITEANLNLDYFCSYSRESNGTLISIPLDVMESDDTILTDFILEEVIKKEDQITELKKQQAAKNKADRIATLEKELKSLKKK